MPHIIELSDLSIPELQHYANLTHRDARKTDNIFLAESEKVIQYALNAGYQPLSFLMEQQIADRICLPEQCNNTPVFTGSRETIRSLTGYVLDRGFLCAMVRPELSDPSSILQNANRAAVLRHISDPTDLGAIFRSAAALGVDCVLIADGCCDPLYRRAVRVSMGTVFQVPWTQISSLSLLAESGFSQVHISHHPDALPLNPSDWSDCEKLAIIVDGTPAPDSWCIPIQAKSEPLNHAAASAVLFWMLRKP